jgi:hypothetical protein
MARLVDDMRSSLCPGSEWPESGTNSNRGVFLAAVNSWKEFKRLSGEKTRFREIPKCQRLVSRPRLDELFSGCGIMENKERNTMLKKAHKEYGYSFSELGRCLGLHYATVSSIVKGE